RSELFRAVFAAGADAFFERNGLLYLGVDELEELADRLAAAQPLLGLLRPAFDGAAVLDAAGRVLDEGGSDAAADALLGELAGAIDAAAAGERSPVEWRRLMLGGGDGAAERRIVVLRPELDFERVQPAAPA